MSNPVLTARGRYGHAVKTRDHAKIETASRDLAAAKLEQYIERVVASAPPLSDEQRDRLVGILRGGAV